MEALLVITIGIMLVIAFVIAGFIFISLKSYTTAFLLFLFSLVISVVVMYLQR